MLKMVNNIAMIIAVAMLVGALVLQIYQIWKSIPPVPEKLRIESKTGETAEINLNGKNDVDELIKFLDILINHK